MGIDTYFSASYVEARARFVAAAGAAGASLFEYECPGHRGYQGERLTVDVAVNGAAASGDAMMIVSGTHGVEGLCGSGCQVGFFVDHLHEALAPGTRAILVHGLNPFGFSWLRRVNEDNVDLNRNFRDFSAGLPPSASYEELHDALLPEDWDGPARAHADMTLMSYAKQRGVRALQAAISSGQHSRADGLFYGGTSEAWSNGVFRRILREHLAPETRRLAVLDLHTGLGPAGYGEPIHVGGMDGALARAREWYGPEVRSTEGDESVSAAVTGCLFDALGGSYAQEITAIGLEFGTQPIMDVLTALRADNWLHAVPGRWHIGDEKLGRIKRQIRDAFYVDTPSWKAAVYGRVADFVLRAARGLAAGDRAGV